MAKQKQDEQLKHTYSSSVRIRDVALKTSQRRSTTGRSGEKELGISVLAARHGDDDDDEKTSSLVMWVECSSIIRETWVQSQVASYERLRKWYLIPPCLTLSNIKFVSRVKWSNPGKGVAPSPAFQYNNY